MRHEYDHQLGFSIGGDIAKWFELQTHSWRDLRNWAGDRTGLNRAVDEVNKALASIDWSRVGAYALTGGFEIFKIFAGSDLDKAAGGLFSRLSSIDDIALRAVRGEGKPEDWNTLLLTALQVGSLAYGGSPAVISFGTEVVLKGTPLGQSELGRALVATVALASGGSGPWLQRLQTSAFDVASKYAEEKVAQSGIISPQVQQAYSIYRAGSSFAKEGKSLKDFAYEKTKTEFVKEVEKKTGLPIGDLKNTMNTFEKLYSGEIDLGEMAKKGFANAKEQLSLSRIADQLQVQIDAISNIDLTEEARKLAHAKFKEESDKFIKKKKEELLRSILLAIRGKRDKRLAYQDFAEFQLELAREEVRGQAVLQGRYNPFADPVIVYGGLAILVGGALLLTGRRK